MFVEASVLVPLQPFSRLPDLTMNGWVKRLWICHPVSWQQAMEQGL